MLSVFKIIFDNRKFVFAGICLKSQVDQRFLPPGDLSHRRPPRKADTHDYPDALQVHTKQNLQEIIHDKNVHVGKSHEAQIDGSGVRNHGDSLLCRN